MDPIHWFLDGKEDIRSSYYLEDVATEFQVQGLELDWVVSHGMQILDIPPTDGNVFLLLELNGITLIKMKENCI